MRKNRASVSVCSTFSSYVHSFSFPATLQVEQEGRVASHFWTESDVKDARHSQGNAAPTFFFRLPTKHHTEWVCVLTMLCNCILCVPTRCTRCTLLQVFPLGSGGEHVRRSVNALNWLTGLRARTALGHYTVAALPAPRSANLRTQAGSGSGCPKPSELTTLRPLRCHDVNRRECTDIRSHTYLHAEQVCVGVITVKVVV